jgi:hypothetical protein
VRVSWLSLKTKVDGVSVVWPQNRWLGFPGLSLKIGKFSLVIWNSKLPRLFLGLCLKTKQALICRLRHKIDGARTAWDTRRDLVEASRVRVSQSSLKIGGGATTGSVYGTITEVASRLS